jgi:K+-sensing histidine kinase KdpD
LGQVLYSIQSLFQFQNIIYLNHSLEIGILLNNVLLALALGSNLKLYKDEKHEAEINEINALKEKEKFIHEQSIILENLIKDRNKELIEKIGISARQKQEIEVQNERLNESIEEIDKINKILIQKNQEILDQNNELEQHHKLLEETVNKRTKKLIKARERAIVADKLKTSFLNNLTHEINTPMNAITGFSSLITDKSISNESRNEYLNNINRYVDILLDSVDNIVTLSRIQAGIIKAKYTETNIAQLSNNLQNHFSEKISLAGKNIVIDSNFKNEHAVSPVSADYNKIWQIINILIDNLIKLMQTGEIKINFSLNSPNRDTTKKNFLQIEIIIIDNFQIQQTLKNIHNNVIKNKAFNMKYDDPTELAFAIIKGLLKIIKGKIKIKIKEESTTVAQLKIPVLISNQAQIHN